MQTADVTEELARRVVAAAGRALDVELTPEQALIQASPREGVDYQGNLAMSLGKRLGRPPREVAEAIAGALELDGIADPPEIAGPGFLNFVLREEWLEDRTAALLGDPRLGVPETAVAAADRAGLQQPERRQGDARRAPAHDGDRRRARAAAAVRRARSAAAQPSRRLGHAVRHAHRAPARRPGRATRHRRPRRVLPRSAPEVRRRRSVRDAGAHPRRAAAERRRGDPRPSGGSSSPSRPGTSTRSTRCSASP